MTNIAAPASSPPLQRGDAVQLYLHSWGRLGEAMAVHDGHDIFVFGGIPGETVIAEIIATRRKYLAAQVTQVLQPSPHRVSPPCPYFGRCTGCQWQHLDYPAQLNAKTGIVRDAMSRIGSFHRAPVLPTLPAPQPLEYRNHARFTIWRSTGELGFVHRERRRFIRIDRCMLMHNGINRLLEQLQEKCAETSQLSIRASSATGDYLIQPTLDNPDLAPASGQKTYQETVAGRTFRVASPSFFQVNINQAARLVDLVRNALQLTGSETVLDAYAGVGVFAALLAADANRIIAVEESTAAIADAAINLDGIPNASIISGKVENVLPEMTPPPDAVVLDPSRTGCHPAALNAVLAMRPARIAYVSCNPESLARDLRTLCQAYRVEWIQPIDMFPQTYHIECVAALSRKPHNAAIILASASPRRRELLSGLRLDFTIAPSHIPEEQQDGESPEQMVWRLSRAKALAAAAQQSAAAGYYIAADSTVVLDGQAIAKPVDAADARAMLSRLRGAAHQVITGLTAYDAATGRCLTESMSADVVMRNFTDAEMEQSIASGTPMDKAGAYAIQDAEFRPARLTHGCYSNVMGLPVCRITNLLAELGCPLPDLSAAAVPPGCTVNCPFAAATGPTLDAGSASR